MPAMVAAVAARGKHKKKRVGEGTKKESKDKDEDGESGAGARLKFYKEVAQSIGCQGITDGIVQNVCESIRKAIIRDVQKHGHYKLAHIGVFRLKHFHGKPTRKLKLYDKQKKDTVEKTFAATPPYKRLTGRALAPLKRIFRESYDEGAEPVLREQ